MINRRGHKNFPNPHLFCVIKVFKTATWTHVWARTYGTLARVKVTKNYEGRYGGLVGNVRCVYEF